MLFSGPKAGWAASGISRLLLGQLSSVLSSAAGGPAPGGSFHAGQCSWDAACKLRGNEARAREFFLRNDQPPKPSRLNPPAHCQCQCCAHTHSGCGPLVANARPTPRRRKGPSSCNGHRPGVGGAALIPQASSGRGAGDGVATRTSFTTSIKRQPKIRSFVPPTSSWKENSRGRPRLKET